MSLSRRSLLGMGAAGVATAGLSLALPRRLDASDRKRPKNVIFCVADGMAIQTMSMADHFQKMTTGRPSYWRTLMNEELANVDERGVCPHGAPRDALAQQPCDRLLGRELGMG